jgi:hypothetical protein
MSWLSGLHLVGLLDIGRRLNVWTSSEEAGVVHTSGTFAPASQKRSQTCSPSSVRSTYGCFISGLYHSRRSTNELSTLGS